MIVSATWSRVSEIKPCFSGRFYGLDNGEGSEGAGACKATSGDSTSAGGS